MRIAVLLNIVWSTSVLYAYTYEPYYADGDHASILTEESLIYEYRGITKNIHNFIRRGGNLVLSFGDGLQNSNVANAVAESGARGVNFYVDDIEEERGAISLAIRRNMDSQLRQARVEGDHDLFNDLLKLRVDAVMASQRVAVQNNLELLLRLQKQLTNIRWTVVIDARGQFGVDEKVYQVLHKYVENDVKIHVVNVLLNPERDIKKTLEQVALRVKFISDRVPHLRSPYKMMAVTLTDDFSSDAVKQVHQIMVSKGFVFLSTTESYRYKTQQGNIEPGILH